MVCGLARVGARPGAGGARLDGRGVEAPHARRHCGRLQQGRELDGPRLFRGHRGTAASPGRADPRGPRHHRPRQRQHRRTHGAAEGGGGPVRLCGSAAAFEGRAGGTERRGPARAHHQPVSGGDGGRIPGHLARPVCRVRRPVPGGGQRRCARPVPDRRSEAVDLWLPGADIHSYLAARRATAGRHYRLGTNYRSTAALVHAVNQLFLHAEGDAAKGHAGFARGAFRFRTEAEHPLPFDAVSAASQAESLMGVAGKAQALAIATCDADDLKTDDYRKLFAGHCAEHIVGLLNDPQVGFEKHGVFTRLAPADIAVLVRDRKEARAVRQALMARQVRSVYLSDQDSVIDSAEAADLLRWLTAVANPLDGTLARAAFATTTADLPLAELARMAADELVWEERVEQLKNLHAVWQRQGVLAMLRRFIHELGLPPRLLAQPGGERRLTNLLHLAELLQSASRGLDGEQALIRWFAEQLAGLGEAGDERVLRLESDAELVKVVTVHKSKGLEYPLVYLPFSASARRTERKHRSFFEYTDDAGRRVLDLALTDEALAAVDRARLEEDLRLLYVAVTRARHFLWLGVVAVATRKAGENRLH